jgi:hypothetical protein
MAIIMTLNGPYNCWSDGIRPDPNDPKPPIKRFTEDEIKFLIGGNCTKLATLSLPGVKFYWDALWEIKQLPRNGYATVTAQTDKIHGTCVSMREWEMPL